MIGCAASAPRPGTTASRRAALSLATRPLMLASACELAVESDPSISTSTCASSPRTRLSWKRGGITTAIRTRPERIICRAWSGLAVTAMILNVLLAPSLLWNRRLSTERS